ncbi:hypothetical protein [Nocardia sp. JMUB6875]|uniref:hypothetical protein n=1 Tax=Nocardia sp. JMUB6875 TaxID=3158170 RepID=UPI0034E88346
MRIPMTDLARAIPARIGMGVVIVGLCGACGSTTGGSAGPAETVAAQQTTAVQVTTTPKETKASGLPSAADGTNLDACKNGNCEIQVDGPTTIPIPGYTRLGGPVKIGQIAPGSVTATSSLFGFPVSGTTGVGGTISLNGLSVKVVAVHGSSAVLRLST